MRPLFRPRAALCLLAISLGLAGCATGRALQRARTADELRDFDLAIVQYTNVLRVHPDNREAQLGLQRAKLLGSDAHLERGRLLASKADYDNAVVELQIASDLNPTNSDAQRELQKARAAQRAALAKPAEGQTPLETLLATAHTLPATGYHLPNVRLGSQITTGRQATSRDLYLLIGKLANLSVIFDSEFHATPAVVSLRSDMTVPQALDAIAGGTSTFYQVTTPSTITVIPDTPAKRREYTQEAERVFYVQNADLKETIDALRTVSDIRSISPITGTNAILVRDTPDRLALAARFLSAFDKARPEVVVDVEILEVNRTKLQEYGLQFASAGSPGINGSVAVNAANLTAKSLQTLTTADILVSGVPALYYRLLKTDTNTRTLANPHIRMSDGIAASAEFGENVPVPSATIGAIAQGGVNTVPITQYTYKNIGVNIDITPRVHANDDVTLALDIELSNVDGTGFGDLPTFGNREVKTTLRLKDGETNILAGLIRDDERYGTRGHSRSGCRARPEPPLHAQPEGGRGDGRRGDADAAHHPHARPQRGRPAAPDVLPRRKHGRADRRLVGLASGGRARAARERCRAAFIRAARDDGSSRQPGAGQVARAGKRVVSSSDRHIRKRPSGLRKDPYAASGPTVPAPTNTRVTATRRAGAMPRLPWASGSRDSPIRANTPIAMPKSRIAAHGSHAWRERPGDDAAGSSGTDTETSTASGANSGCNAIVAARPSPPPTGACASPPGPLPPLGALRANRFSRA